MKTISELAKEANTTEQGLQAIAKLIPKSSIEFLHEGRIVKNEDIKLIIACVAIQLGKADEKHFPLIKNAQGGKLRYVGIQVEHKPSKSYLIPSINGQAFPEIKCEFTQLMAGHVKVCPPTYHKDAILARTSLAKAKTSADAINVLIENAVLKVGSIGCRSTNQGTDYQLIFNHILTEDARDLLKPLIDLKNEQNEGKEMGFILTHLSEIAQFMDSIGQTEFLLEQINQVREFEEVNDLREIYAQNNNRIPNYKDHTKIIEIEIEILEIGQRKGLTVEA